VWNIFFASLIDSNNRLIDITIKYITSISLSTETFAVISLSNETKQNYRISKMAYLPSQTLSNITLSYCFKAILSTLSLSYHFQIKQNKTTDTIDSIRRYLTGKFINCKIYYLVFEHTPMQTCWLVQTIDNALGVDYKVFVSISKYKIPNSKVVLIAEA
jgi:hypothetical protein